MADPAQGRPKFPLALDRLGRGAARPDERMLRPQRLVEAAVADAQRLRPPTGAGLDGDAVRRRMVERLRADGLGCEPVLAALGRVPRHLFVDPALRAQAYEDTSLPIGLGQTISKPSVVGRMLALLQQRADAVGRSGLGRVLEIGTGCGYQAALLGTLSRSVLSIERLKPLHELARERLAPLRADGVRLVYGDGRLGHAPQAPYDSIIAAAGGEALPQPWLDQLAVGGRLVAPMAGPQGGQVLVVVDRDERGLHQQWHEAVKFVPLKSGLD